MPTKENARKFPFDYFLNADPMGITSASSTSSTPSSSKRDETAVSNTTSNGSPTFVPSLPVPLSEDLSKEATEKAFPELYTWNTTSRPRVLWNLECMNGLGNILDGYTQNFWRAVFDGRMLLLDTDRRPSRWRSDQGGMKPAKRIPALLPTVFCAAFICGHAIKTGRGAAPPQITSVMPSSKNKKGPNTWAG